MMGSEIFLALGGVRLGRRGREVKPHPQGP